MDEMWYLLSCLLFLYNGDMYRDSVGHVIVVQSSYIDINAEVIAEAEWLPGLECVSMCGPAVRQLPERTDSLFQLKHICELLCPLW